MYFPTSTARQLCTVPEIPNIEPQQVVSLAASPRKSLFCTLTASGLSVWRVRPPAILAHLSRTPTSVLQHGENWKAHWAQDGAMIVIQTKDSWLVLVILEYRPDETAYQPPVLGTASQRNFLPGPGESTPLQSISLRLEGAVRIEGDLLSVSPRRNYIIYSMKHPPAVQQFPWPAREAARGRPAWSGFGSWVLNDQELPWLVDSNVYVAQILHSRTTGMEIWLTSDGRAYVVRLLENAGGSTSDLGLEDETSQSSDPVDAKGKNAAKASFDSTSSQPQRQHTWQGTCIHDVPTPRWVEKSRQSSSSTVSDAALYDEPRRAVAAAINAKFSLVAVGTHGGSVEYTSFPSQDGVLPKPQVLSAPNTYNRPTGPVFCMEWSSDGYVLAVGWLHGWAIFSVGGRCLAWGLGLEDSVDEDRFHDAFMHGVSSLFWAPGNFELVMLAQSSPNRPEGQLFVVPFAKSATTGQHSPDNTRYAFLQMDDRALVYRGADQPDMSVINPESDVWQHIKLPQAYLANNWPIRFSSLSTDGRLIAVAGRRGLVHYSATSGRWKAFADLMQEQAFTVKGGMVWFHHVLIAAVEVAKSYQIRLYSRDLELSNQNVLHRELVPSPVVILSLVDNSLLVYTLDNTLFHYLIVPTEETIKLHLCGSISFTGIIASPPAVRVLSWMIPSAQKQLGDPVDDLQVATVLMMVGGQLVLLRPRKVYSQTGTQEVRYDMQIFADRIEFCWTHLRGIGALENSLWGYDGQGIRVWLNALAIESAPSSSMVESPKSVKESVNIHLDFYPLSVLMDKGIIIGAEHETATRSNLPFVMFRHATSSHLFLHHILLYHLEAGQVRDAVLLAAHYQHLVYFAHALEILLHTVVESDITPGDDHDGSDSDPEDRTLQTVVEFLDHFDACLDVVVGCARKTEMTRWRRLFKVVGNPNALFETCLTSQRLKTAGSYLLVLHNLEQLDEHNGDAVRLLKAAIQAKDWQLCRELLRFLHSIDDTGAALRSAVSQTDLSVSDTSEVVHTNGVLH